MLSDKEINEIYNLIKKCWEKHLKSKGVLLSSLKRSNKYTKDCSCSCVSG